MSQDNHPPASAPVPPAPAVPEKWEVLRRRAVSARASSIRKQFVIEPTTVLSLIADLAAAEARAGEAERIRAAVGRLHRFIPLCSKCSVGTPIMMCEESTAREADVIHRDGRWVRDDQLIAALASPAARPTEERP